MISTEQPVTVLPWHREAAKEIDNTALDSIGDFPDETHEVVNIEKAAAIIARHDPHAETLRLLEECANALDAARGASGPFTNEIRAHLAAQKGSQ